MNKPKFYEIVKIDKFNHITILINVNEISRIEYNHVNLIRIYLKKYKEPIQYCNDNVPKIYDKLKSELDIKKII